MSKWKRNALFAAWVVACTVAVALFVILSSPIAESRVVGTAPPTFGQAQPRPEPVPDKGSVTSTHIFTDITQTFRFAKTCTGALETVTISFSGVLQVTYLGSGPHAGTFRVSGTETGMGQLIPADPALPSYTGHFTIRFDTNTTADTGTATTNLNIHAVGSDGSLLYVHLVEHTTITATGVVVSFDHLTCG
jgi:hypothetical protein